MAPKMKRLNVDDPVVMASLLRSGAIWSVPQYWQQAVKAIEGGLVPLAQCKNVPPEVAASLAK